MNKIIPHNNDKDAIEYLKDTFQALSEFITGVASSEKKDWALSIGYLLQRVRGGNFLNQLMIELDKYKERGQIKEDYLKTEQSITCLQEMLDFLDKDSPDQLRFDFLKKLFLSAASEEVSSRESYLPQQIIQICRKLKSGEILVLKAAREIAKDNKAELKTNNTADWLHEIANKAGLKHAELVEIHEKSLMEKNLISPRLYNDGSVVSMGSTYRLTPLAMDMFEFIKNYDENV
jgi:actin-related protein